MSPKQAADMVVIAAAPDVVAEAALDVESYPAWTRSVRQVTVKERDPEGRATVVGFVAAALGRRVRYTLRYDYSGLPEAYSWTLLEGDLKEIDGEYRFEKDGDGRTRVNYRLRVELGFPLPGFVLRRAERLVLSRALKELKAYVEE